MKGNDLNIASATSRNDELASKTADLVFFNIPEAESGDTENCDKIILNLLISEEFFDQEYTLELDHAHRLGP